jgi:hypothetical protein
MSLPRVNLKELETPLGLVSRIEELTAPQIRVLMSMIAAGQKPVFEGVTYSSTEVANRNRVLLSQPRSRALPSTYGSLVLQKGLNYSTVPEKDENGDLTGDIKVNLHKVEGDKIVTIGEMDSEVAFFKPTGSKIGKDFVPDHPYHIKEDAQFFASRFACRQSAELGKQYFWEYIVHEKCFIHLAFKKGKIAHTLLDMLQPNMPLSGLTLINWILATRSSWPIVRAIVYHLLNDVVIGKKKIFLERDQEQLRFVRTDRPSEKKFSLPSGDAHKVNTAIEREAGGLGLSNHLDIYSGYYNGLDLEKNMANIHAKARILESLDLSFIPNGSLYVSTNNKEEYRVLSFVLAKKGLQVEQINPKAVVNVGHRFVLHCEPQSAPSPKAATEKQAVNQSMLKDSALLQMVSDSAVPKGMGFFNTMLVHHHDKGNEATPSAACGTVSRYRDVQVGSGKDTKFLRFKMLHSAMPLHYHPYVFWNQSIVNLAADRPDPVANKWEHLMCLAQYPFTMITWTGKQGISTAPLDWTLGVLDFDERTFSDVVRTRKIAKTIKESKEEDEKVELKGRKEKAKPKIELKGRRAKGKEPEKKHEDIGEVNVGLSLRKPDLSLLLGAGSDSEESSSGSENVIKIDDGEAFDDGDN